MTRIAIVSAVCAFAMAVSATVAAEEPTNDVAAEEAAEEAAARETAARDTAVVKACLDVGESRRVAAEAAEAANAVSPDETKMEKKTGPEGHLEAAALTAAYAPESCIGVLASPCMETEEAGSTYGMMDCYGRELEVWDARLNASYRERLAPQTGPGSNAATEETEAKQLRKIQATWIPWRDATCEVLYSDGIPIYGSMAKIDAVHCNMVLTARQALWIEGLLTLGFE